MNPNDVYSSGYKSYSNDWLEEEYYQRKIAAASTRKPREKTSFFGGEFEDVEEVLKLSAESTSWVRAMSEGMNPNTAREAHDSIAKIAVQIDKLRKGPNYAEHVTQACAYQVAWAGFTENKEMPSLSQTKKAARKELQAQLAASEKICIISGLKKKDFQKEPGKAWLLTEVMFLWGNEGVARMPAVAFQCCLDSGVTYKEVVETDPVTDEELETLTVLYRESQERRGSYSTLREALEGARAL